MIRLSNVIFNYQSMPMMFDLHIQAQEKIAIIGESGAGQNKGAVLARRSNFNLSNT